MGSWLLHWSLSCRSLLRSNTHSSWSNLMLSEINGRMWLEIKRLHDSMSKSSAMIFFVIFFELNFFEVRKFLALINYMYYSRCSSFWLLVESHDFSQAACKSEKNHKITTTFTQNDNLGPFWVKLVVILWICSALLADLSFLAWEKSRDSTPNSQKLKNHKIVLKGLIQNLNKMSRDNFAFPKKV